MRINIESVLKNDAASCVEFDYSIKNPEDFLNLLGAETVNFVKISGKVLRKNNVAMIEYNISADFSAECARCLKIAKQNLKVSGYKYLATEKEAEEYSTDFIRDSEDYYILEGGFLSLDLEEFAREFLGLEVPLRWLCKEDCKGLCENCGKDLNENNDENGECDCNKIKKNPAFNILDGLFK